MNTKYVLMAIVTCVFISEASPADAGLQCAIVGYHCTVIDYPGSTGSNTNEATGINDAGTIVGTWGNDGQVQGYMYDHGYFSALPQPPGYDFAHPNSINNRGDIVASVEATPISPVYPYVYFDGPPDPLPGTGAFLGLGNILYGASDDLTDRPHGFIEDPRGAARTPFTCSGYASTALYDANDAGTWVGWVGDNPLPGQAYIHAGGACNTIVIPGATSSLALSISSNDLVSGDYYDPSGPHGFVWNNGKLALLDVLGSSNTEIAGINDRGQIVGGYTDNAGIQHGFTATVAEPNSFRLLTVGVVGLLLGHRRWRQMALVFGRSQA